MIIYEVNLTIKPSIYREFVHWLKDHAKEMLQFPGFVQASILKPELEEKVSDEEALTIQYQLKTRKDLEYYFTEFAPMMREKGLARFKDQFSARRRIFELQEIIRN